GPTRAYTVGGIAAPADTLVKLDPCQHLVGAHEPMQANTHVSSTAAQNQVLWHTRRPRKRLEAAVTASRNRQCEAPEPDGDLHDPADGMPGAIHAPHLAPGKLALQTKQALGGDRVSVDAVSLPTEKRPQRRQVAQRRDGEQARTKIDGLDAQ